MVAKDLTVHLYKFHLHRQHDSPPLLILIFKGLMKEADAQAASETMNASLCKAFLLVERCTLRILGAHQQTESGSLKTRM